MSAESTPDAQVNFAELYRRLDEARAVLERGQSISAEHRREVLAARAKALAGSREEVRQELLSVLAFQVGAERYAVPLAAVDHVLEARGMCPLPGAPRHVLGALVSRARVVAVLDLRQLLGLEGGGMSDLTRVVVVDVGEEAFGLAAELVDGRLELPVAELMRPPPGPFTHLGPNRLTILDLEQLGDAGAARRE
jgi:purine-binding chemotaxis protein CheW